MAKPVKMNSGIQMTLMASAIALSLLSSQASLAQDAAKKADEDKIEEIVVTATLRSENIRSIPMSITAFSQEQMDKQGVRSVDDIARLTPGVTFTRFGNFGSSINIRGISSSAGAATTAIYIDDTPVN